MSKSRIMGAASSGYNYGANKSSPGNGNGKWQGLPAIRNMRSGLIRYVNTRARGDNRNVVFFMNQVGGIGMGNKHSQFASSVGGYHKSLFSSPPITIDFYWHQHTDEFNAFSCWANHDMANLEGIAWYLGEYDVKEGVITKLQVELIDQYSVYDSNMDSTTRTPNICTCDRNTTKDDCNKETGPSSHGGSKKQPCIWNDNRCIPNGINSSNLVGKGIQGLFTSISGVGYIPVPQSSYPKIFSNMSYEKSDADFINNKKPALSVWYSTPLKGYCGANAVVGTNCTYKVRSCEYIEVSNLNLPTSPGIIYNKIPYSLPKAPSPGDGFYYYGVYEGIAKAVDEGFTKSKSCSSSTHPTFPST